MGCLSKLSGKGLQQRMFFLVWYSSHLCLNYPKTQSLRLSFDSVSHPVQWFFGVHQPWNDPIQPVQSSWPVTSVWHDGMWPWSWSGHRFWVTSVSWECDFCRSEKVRRSGESPIRSLSMGSASLWWWPPGTRWLTLIHINDDKTVGPSHLLWRKLRIVCKVNNGIIFVSSFQSLLPLFSLFLSSCVSEMERWLEDIRMAIDLAEQSISPNTDLLSASLPDNSKVFFYLLKKTVTFYSSILSLSIQNQ